MQNEVKIDNFKFKLKPFNANYNSKKDEIHQAPS